MKVEYGLKDRARKKDGPFKSVRHRWDQIKQDCKDAGLTKGEANRYMYEYAFGEIPSCWGLIEGTIDDVFRGITGSFGFHLTVEDLSNYLTKVLGLTSTKRPSLNDVEWVARANRYKMNKSLSRDGFYINHWRDKLASLEGGMDSL